MRKRDWLVPLSLFLFAAMPLIPGVLRLIELGGGPVTIPVNPRAVGMPLPIVIHVVGAMGYTLLGALQFSAGIRRAAPRLHRITGRIAWPFGLAAALSALWMTLFFLHPPEATVIVTGARLVFGTLMLAGLLLGLAAILRRDVPTHQAWMTRAYAVGLGDATQMVLLLPLGLAGITDIWISSMLMAAAWVINLAVAEWSIRRSRAPKRPAVLAAVPA